MSETLPSRTKLSPGRAKEIIDFIQHDIEIGLGNVTSLSILRTLAQEAFETLGLQLPTDFDTLIERKIDKISTKEKRQGFALTPERARIFFNHLLGRVGNPQFRDKDTILIKRMLLRQAIALVAREEEEKTCESHHYLLAEAGKIVDEKYPLAA